MPVLFVSSGCSGLQSALDPAGVGAEGAALLWWVMLAGATVIFLLVLVPLIVSCMARIGQRTPIAPLTLIVGGGVALPVVVLSALLVFGTQVGARTGADVPDDAQTIRVTGWQWWWEVEYLDQEGRPVFTTANEIHLPVGEPVELLLRSADVVHSLWVPRLGGKLDLVPGRTNRLVLQAEKPGISRAQCAEFCGLAHAQMALFVIAAPPEVHERWMADQRAPARAPESAAAQRGATAFATRGCLLCHTVRGHGAWGRVAPDLTHVGGRRTIGAGVLPTRAETIAAWIADNHRIKPGNRMPEFRQLDEAVRSDIGAYLAGLE